MVHCSFEEFGVESAFLCILELMFCFIEFIDLDVLHMINFQSVVYTIHSVNFGFISEVIFVVRLF